ncbi:hypothetical protein GH714_025868 [Hevea brasiliensis]|uniref:40S ribosomal protein S6 n=1 Tax=Hevea brasiliensis TaxID=3981 RepID=A0A6A6KSH4_HEVBR|nr:hypothetical protein GH714_025868 [Hevea brasiliensis]
MFLNPYPLLPFDSVAVHFLQEDITRGQWRCSWRGIQGICFQNHGRLLQARVPMKQGVLTPGRVRLLLHRRNGERRRKSVLGCIVSPDLSFELGNCEEENDLPGLTDTEKPRMRGPKRASKIRKLFNLSKEDDFRKYVNTYRRSFTTKSGKKVSEAPKIQKLVTPLTLQRKRARIARKRKELSRPRQKMLSTRSSLPTRLKEQRERRSESLDKKR